MKVWLGCQCSIWCLYLWLLMNHEHGRSGVATNRDPSDRKKLSSQPRSSLKRGREVSRSGEAFQDKRRLAREREEWELIKNGRWKGMPSHVAIATSHAAEDKGWSCTRPLSLSLFSLSLPPSLSHPRYTSIAVTWPSEQLPYALGEQITRREYCPSDCVISHLLTRGWGRHFNPATRFFLLPKPESAIHSRMDHMLTSPFVCMRQCCCLYHF